MNGQTNTILLGVIALLIGVQVFAGLTKKDSPVRPQITQSQNAPATQTNQVNQGSDISFDQNMNMEREAAPTPSGPLTSISFNETFYDFGTIPEGIKRSKNFTFTNTGDEPLIISNAKGSCGCTVPEYPRHPIAPGETGEITVEYNSANRNGNVTNTVTITANTQPAENTIRISANVVKES